MEELVDILEQATYNGMIECPECGANLEPDCPKCKECGWENPLISMGMI